MSIKGPGNSDEIAALGVGLATAVILGGNVFRYGCENAKTYKQKIRLGQGRGIVAGIATTGSIAALLPKTVLADLTGGGGIFTLGLLTVAIGGVVGGGVGDIVAKMNAKKDCGNPIEKPHNGRCCERI